MEDIYRKLKGYPVDALQDWLDTLPDNVKGYIPSKYAPVYSRILDCARGMRNKMTQADTLKQLERLDAICEDMKDSN